MTLPEPDRLSSVHRQDRLAVEDPLVDLMQGEPDTAATGDLAALADEGQPIGRIGADDRADAPVRCSCSSDPRGKSP